MSKERLEEIKEDVFKCNHGSTRGYSYEQLYHIALSLVRIHGEWLIEQAERTQELEEIAETDGSSFHTLEKLFMESEQQNKRYRELIKKMKRMVYDPDVDCGMICTEIIEMEES